MINGKKKELNIEATSILGVAYYCACMGCSPPKDEQKDLTVLAYTGTPYLRG